MLYRQPVAGYVVRIAVLRDVNRWLVVIRVLPAGVMRIIPGIRLRFVLLIVAGQLVVINF